MAEEIGLRDVRSNAFSPVSSDDESSRRRPAAAVGGAVCNSCRVGRMDKMNPDDVFPPVAPPRLEGTAVYNLIVLGSVAHDVERRYFPERARLDFCESTGLGPRNTKVY